MQLRHDPTYYFATRRLPAELRPATHALYGYVRTADQIVDGPRRPATPDGPPRGAGRLGGGARRGQRSRCQPIVRALADAAARHRLPLGELRTYMRSMRIDCAPVRIASWEELVAYMDGSAGSVGRIMAALLGVPARHHADLGRLGIAFQLANFIRDVREDTTPGPRSTCPQEDRARFGVSEATSRAAHATPGGPRAARPRGRARPRPVRRRAPGDRLRARVGAPRHPLRDRASTAACSTASRRRGFDVLGRQAGRPRLAHPGRGAGGAAMTRRGDAARRGAHAARARSAPTC